LNQADWQESMLYFSRMTTAAILLTVLVVCGFAVPNLFPEETTRNWPAWAQGRLVLGPDVQGGTSVLLEVDRNDVVAILLDEARQEVRRTLRDARIGWRRAPAARGNAVEVRLREEDVVAGFAQLREVFQPLNGVHEFDVVDGGSGLVRLTPTEAAIADRTRLTVAKAMPMIERRLNLFGVKATVRRQRLDRISLQVPGHGDPRVPGGFYLPPEF
jgi:preprotein translocase subunit SecD